MFATLQSYQVDYSAYTAKELITKGETVLKGKYTEKYFPVWYNKDVVVPVSLRTEVSGKIVGVLVGTPKVHLNVDQPGTFAVYTIGIGLIVLSGCSRRYTSKANRSPGVRMFGRFLTVSIPCFLLGLGLYLWDVPGIKSSDFFGLLLECILCSGAWLCVHLHMLSRRVRLDAWGRSTRVHQHHNR
jgi:hypothetical protein